MAEQQPGFIPAEVGDLACFERAPGEWVYGLVQQVTKSQPRVRLLLDNQGEQHKVGPSHHIRLVPMHKVDQDAVMAAWKEGPSIFDSWEKVSELMVKPYRKTGGSAD